MEVGILDRFQSALVARRDGLRAWLRAGAPGPALPDRPEVGPVEEACCPALDEIDHALDEIAHGAFGRCARCDGEVEEERLALDYTACVCLDHYSPDELRGLERDLELAAQVQRLLLPCCVPSLPGVAFAAHAQPAGVVGGDYYDFFAFRERQQGVALADVMGKGVAASMLMANLQASLRILGPEHDALDALAARLNGLFAHNLRLIRFISLFLLAVDEEAGRIQYVNAGHHPPLLWDAAAREVRRLRPTGPALGLLAAPTFTAQALPFAPGDALVLYTDGLVEARSPGGEEFGEGRLAHLLTQHHAEPAEALLARLRAAVGRFTGGRLHDDLSLLVIRRT